MASTTQQTVDYPGIAPAASEPERVRVALVGGSGGPKSDDLHQLLRRRLLIVNTIAAIYFIIGSILMAFAFWRISRNGDFERLIGFNKALEVITLTTVSLAVTAGSTLILWRRPPKSINGLRAIEMFGFVVLAFIQLRDVISLSNYDVLTRLPTEPVEIRLALFGNYVAWQALTWFVSIVLYGTIIPNTARRCVIVIGFMALSPLALFALYSFWVKPLPVRVAADALIL